MKGLRPIGPGGEGKVFPAPPLWSLQAAFMLRGTRNNTWRTATTERLVYYNFFCPVPAPTLHQPSRFCPAEVSACVEAIYLAGIRQACKLFMASERRSNCLLSPPPCIHTYIHAQPVLPKEIIAMPRNNLPAGFDLNIYIYLTFCINCPGNQHA